MSAKNITAATLGFLAISAVAAPQLLQAQQAAPPTFQMPSAIPASGAQPGPAMGSMTSPGPTQMQQAPAASAPAAPAQNVNLTGGISNKLPVRTDLLQTIMDRQEEMLLLDLDIKKATMEKQLREAKKAPEEKASSSQSSDTSFREVDRMMQSSFAPQAPISPLPIEDLGMLGSEPQVMRIRKENNEMVAMIKLEDDSVILAREGDTLTGGWKITAITPSSVSVNSGRKNSKTTQLKFSPPANSGQGEGGQAGGGTMGTPSLGGTSRSSSAPAMPSIVAAPMSMR